MKDTLRLFAVTILLLLTSSCRQGQIELGDGGFLLDQGCYAPCFMDITPGATNEVQVFDILKQKGYYEDCMFYEENSGSDSHGIVCFDNISIAIENQSDTVESVGFSPSSQVLVEDAIGKYGEPSMVAIFTDDEPFTIRVSLYFAEISSRLDLPSIDGSEYLIEPTNTISHIVYFDNSTYKNNIAQSNAFEWQGYTIYSE